ncbi:helix-turn-helix domain-containing protein [Paenibacillus alkalitolerans]|uniref:helix-turn-helix domain-containing protein n=1 Tax=Paenibacillus alkalitolerans TaxID=2799335 RepID=UPI0018F4307A|nr:helix-turn-helix domain-containing protein [Paenibacillus alkalitolerans]
MIGKLNRSPVFYKYLASYIVVLLIPLLFLGVSGYEQIVKVIHNEVTMNNRDKLAQLKDSVDAKVIQMNKIAAEIAVNPDLTPYALTKSFYRVYEAKSLLNYKMANEFLKEVLLYIRGGEFMYSSVSTYKVPLFINDIYRFRNWNEDAFYKDINSMTISQFRPAEEVRMWNNDDVRMVTYIVPIPAKSKNPYGTVLYLIPESALLHDEYTGRSGNTVILDERNRVIASLKDESYLLDPGFYSSVMKSSGGQGSEVRTFNETDYFVSHEKSKATGWTYITLLPVAEVLKPVDEVRNRWLHSLVVILLIGSVIIYGLIRVNYHPVKQLMQWAEMQLLNSQPAIKDHLLLSLLKGEFESIEEFNERGRVAGLAFTNSHFFVVLFEFPKNQAATIKEKLIGVVAERLTERIEAYSKDSVEEDRVIFILSTSLDGDRLEQWLKELHRSLIETVSIPVTMGVGSLYRDAGQVGKSYIEASTAVDYKLIKGNNKIIFFNEAAAVDSRSIAYPTQSLEQLEILIKQGNADKITEALADISDKIRANATTLFAARCLCFDIVNTVMKAMVEIYAVVPETKKQFPDVLSLMQFDTVEELTEAITAACADLCRVMRENNANSSEPLITAIIAYMRENYTNPDFSIQNMADHFSISISYASRYVKEQTGRNISDYVNQMRIDYARRLLKSEDCSLKEIVERIGYYDVSSFIRKFKKTVGVTPGEYRRLYKNAG